jgi:hypothetical protein
VELSSATLGLRANADKLKSHICHCFFLRGGLSEKTVAANTVRLPDHLHRVNQPFVNVTVNGATMDIYELGSV